MNDDLKKEIEELKVWKTQMENSSTIPLFVDQAFTGRGYIKLISTGILQGNADKTISGITPLSGTKTYYVSDTVGGTVNRKLAFYNGILISET
jgi:hypothetical protein